MHEPRIGPPTISGPKTTSDPKTPQGTEAPGSSSATPPPYAHLATPPDIIRWDLGERATAEKPSERLCVTVVGGHHLAIVGKHSQGIQEVDDPTPIPLAPPHILGLTHVRGHILPVVDLVPFLGPGFQKESRVPIGSGSQSTLVLRLDEVQLCFVVDEVVAFEPFDMESIQPPTLSNPDTDPWRGLLAGTAHLDGFEPLPVLDLAAAIAALRLSPGDAE